MIFAIEPSRAVAIASTLEAAGYLLTQHDQPNIAAEILHRERPALVIVAEGGSLPGSTFPHLQEAAGKMRIPTLAVLATGQSPRDLGAGYDDWVSTANLLGELPVRAHRLISRPADATIPAIDSQFLALVVHDLRTPLNVINLTIRAIGQSNPTPNADFEEDLSFLQENSKQIEKMLAQLGDYCRLVESEQHPAALEFETRRFLTDFLEEKQAKRDSEFKAVRLEIAADSPVEVALDPNRVRLAIQHAVANAVAAAGDAPIRLRSRGPAGRWTIDVIIDKAPPPTTAPTPLQPHIFERLIGSAAERRGLDLAIAARVSELFGGSARLDVEPGTRSIISLDWPTRFTP